MKPQRVQRKRMKNWRMPPNTIYVGRGSPWGNPWRVGGPQAVSREEAIRRFTVICLPLVDLAPLRGKNLACWCRLDEACHADVLLEAANR